MTLPLTTLALILSIPAAAYTPCGELINAAEAGLEREAAGLLSAKVDPSCYDAELNRTPLGGATYHKGFAPMVRLLLAAGADPNGFTHFNAATPLSNAAEQRDLDAMRALLAAKAIKPDLAAPKGRAPLFSALVGCSMGDPVETARRAQAVELLLAAGARPYVVDEQGDNPALWAAGCGDVVLTKRLRGLGLPLRSRADFSPFCAAAHWTDQEVADRREILELLVGDGTEVSRPMGGGLQRFLYGNRTPLHCAVSASNLALVRFLLEKKADPAIASPGGLLGKDETPAAAAEAIVGVPAKSWYPERAARNAAAVRALLP